MTANVKLFWILSGFFLLAGIVYTIWNLFSFRDGPTYSTGVAGSPVEWVGTIGLVLTALLAALIAFYVGRVHRAQRGELPEDRMDANVDDGDAEQGFFSPWSWWPVVLAGCAALLFLGVAIGPWIAFIALPIGIIALVGWTYEYFRRYFAH
jgi:membrane protein implicated in regulation of membrane protease activity